MENERIKLVNKLKEIMKIKDEKLTWVLLCKYTYFDSFATAFAFGTNWNETNLGLIPIGHLQMALFNILNFPNNCENCKALEEKNEKEKEGLCVGCEPHSIVDYDFSCGHFKNPRVPLTKLKGE